MNEQGHGLVELLLALPLMLLIIFGAIDLSHSIDNAQAATMLAREGANRGRRVCIRTVPNLTLDQACMERLMIDVPAALESARLLVTVYVIEDNGGVSELRLVDYSASWEGSEEETLGISRWGIDANGSLGTIDSNGDVQPASTMVDFALELRASEDDQADLIRNRSFVVAVAEVFYENQAFSSFSFIPAEGYEVAIF